MASYTFSHLPPIKIGLKQLENQQTHHKFRRVVRLSRQRLRVVVKPVVERLRRRRVAHQLPAQRRCPRALRSSYENVLFLVENRLTTTF